MNPAPLRAVTDQERERYEEDGVVCLRGVFDADWIARMAAAVDRAVERPGPMALDLSQGQAGRFHGDSFVWTWDEDFRSFVFDSPAAPLAASVMGSRKVNLFFDTLLVKEPGSAAPTRWGCWPRAGIGWPASAVIPTARRLGLMRGRRR